MRNFTMVLGLVASATFGSVSALHAQAYPTKTISIIVPYPAGGPADAGARLIADKLQKAMGQPVVIENKPGASNIVANEFVARAPKDGYTLLYATNVLPMHPLTSRAPRYQVGDFAPISLTLIQAYALITSKKLPISNLKEFVEYARKNPKVLNFAVIGQGSVTHLIGERFQHLTKTEMVPVFYRGATDAERDVIGGTVHFFPSSSLSSFQLHNAGELRILGMTADSRAPALKEIPTLKEQGVDLVVETWFGLCAPAGTPQPIIDRLNKEIVAAVASPDFQERMTAGGGIARSTTPAEFAAIIKRTNDELGEGVRALGIQTD